MITSLFVNHKLNYFEALRRMNFWLEEIRNNNNFGGHAVAKVQTLQRVLVKYASELWFDPFYTGQNQTEEKTHE